MIRSYAGTVTPGRILKECRQPSSFATMSKHLLNSMLLLRLSAFEKVKWIPPGHLTWIPKAIPHRYLGPPRSDTTADGVIRTAMQRRIYRRLTHSDQRPLRPPKLLQTKPAISPAADGVIRTAMLRRIFRHPIHPDQRPLRPPTSFWNTPPLPLHRIGHIWIRPWRKGHW